MKVTTYPVSFDLNRLDTMSRAQVFLRSTPCLHRLTRRDLPALHARSLKPRTPQIAPIRSLSDKRRDR